MKQKINRPEQVIPAKEEEVQIEVVKFDLPNKRAIVMFKDGKVTVDVLPVLESLTAAEQTAFKKVIKKIVGEALEVNVTSDPFPADPKPEPEKESE